MADDQERAAAAAADEDMADASSDGSSSDSDFEEIELSPEDAKLLMKLEQQLAANPNLYDSHVQYIEALRRCKMGARLSEARQAFHAAFPLTEALWFDWLSDEIDGLKDADDIPRIQGLMEAAVADYLSIPLWVQYLEFTRDFDPEVQAGGKEGHTRMRDACERALTAGGLHVTEGSKLWDIYRGYELSLLEAEPSEEQAERVRSLWARQLAVPLADGPQALAAYEEWERSRLAGEGWQLPAHLKQSYERARKAVELRQPYEESVGAGKEPGPDLLAAYMAYIRVEEKQGDPGRVQVVYERALAAFPVTHYLWAQYARYLEAHLKIGSVINSVYARAVRNCPWVGQLWGRALRALERSGAPEDQHAALYDKALAAGLQGYEDYMEVILARTDCLRRQGGAAAERLRATFKAAAQLLRSYFPDYVDRSFRLTAYWAECEATVCDGLPAARAVWEAAIKEPVGRYADTWAAFIDFERRRGNIREARTLYKRCYTRKLEEGGQAIMCDAWLRFEREEGSAEDHLQASLKVEPILQELQAAAAAAADPGQHAAARSAADKAPKLSKEEVRAMRQQADPNFAKRKKEQQQQGGAAAAGGGGDMPPPPAKKPRTAATGANTQEAAAPAAAGQQAPAQAAQPEQQQVEQQQQAATGAAASAPAEQQQEQPSDKEAGGQEGEHPEQQAGRLQGAWRQQRHTAPNTAFVKHLADEVDEAAVKELFAGCPGGVASVELGRDKKTGRSRGFAYVHFVTVEGLEAACRLDRSEFHGKHILVAPSKPPGGGGGQQTGGRGGGRFGGGRGQDAGRGGGRGQEGGRGGGRFGGGRGHDGGRSRGGRGGPKHHTMIDLGEAQPAGGGGGASPRGFVPRAAALGGKGGQQGSGQAAEGGAPPANEAPKSNADFRAMFLKK